MSGFAHSLYSLLEGFEREVAAPASCIVCHATTALPFASLTCRRDGCCKQIHIKCALEGSRWGNVGRVLLEDKRLPDLVYDCPQHHTEPLFCVCHKPMNEDPMIQCDECLEWYHIPCLLNDTSMGDESWVCSYCRYNLSRNNTEDLEELKEKKIINKDKDVLATAMQAAQDNLLPFKHLVQNFTSVVDPILKFTSSDGGEQHLLLNNAKLHLPQVHSAIEEFTKIIDSISLPERLGHVLTRAETLRYLCDVRRRLDKVASAYAIISATALDVAKNGNKLFSNSVLASSPFDGPLVSRLAPILEAAAKVETEFEAFPCSSEDDRAFLCYADGIRWIDAFCCEMRGLSAQPDTPAKAQAIDEALRGSALVLRRFADLANEAARLRGVVKEDVFSPTVQTYRGVMAGVTLVSKAAKKLIRHRSFHSGLGGYGHQLASASLGESDGSGEWRGGGRKTQRGALHGYQAKPREALEEDKALDVGIVLQPLPASSAQPTPSPAGAAKQYSAAELRLVALFEAKDQEQRRLDAEKIERAKIIHKGSAYTSAPLPPPPVPVSVSAPVPAAAAAPVPAAAAAPAAKAQAKGKPPAQPTAPSQGVTAPPPLSSPRPAASAAAGAGAAGAAAAEAGAEAGTKKRPALSATAAVEAAAIAAAAAKKAAADPLSIFDAPSTKRVRRNAELAEQVDEEEVVDSSEMEGGIFRDPAGTLLMDSVWDPRSATSGVFLPLPNFGIIYDEDDAELRENNTLAVLMHVPEGAKQWAVNICPANHLDNHNILLHFNPRFAAGKQLRKEIAFNDRVGTWGDSFKERIRDPKEQEKNNGHPTAELLQMRVELLIQVRKEGFVIFVNGKCLCLFPHRRPLHTGEELVVSFPLKDDMAHLQEGQVHKVWWGRQPNALYSVPAHLQQGETLQKWREGTAYMVAHPARTRTVTVTGLPQQSSPVELQFIEDGLRNVFGVKEIDPEAINVVPGRGVAFVRLKTKEEQQLALAELKRYKVQDTSGEKFALKLEAFDDSSPALDFLVGKT